jgi:uncharacterized protein (DUF433 family)
MSQPMAFEDVLDAAEQLDADAQAELVAVLSRRLAERGRERVIAAVAQARREFTAGQCRPMTAAELVQEAMTLTRGPVHSDPSVMGGTLVFRASRVSAQTLLDYLDDGYTLDEFLEMFPSVDRGDAAEFLRLARDEPDAHRP